MPRDPGFVHPICTLILATWIPLVAAGQPTAPQPGDLAKVKVYRSESSYGPYALDGEGLQQTPAGVIPIGFEEPIWVLGYSTEIEAETEIPERELHCHTLMASRSGAGHPAPGQPFKGFFSDGYTRRIVLPQGFGIYFETGEQMILMPMFNNRNTAPLDASMGVNIDFVLASELPRPLTPLFSTAVSIAEPYLYMVPPGRDVRERRFQLPYGGVIHAMGIHIHPYGRQVELINETKGETVWRAEPTVGPNGRLLSSPFYSNPGGYAFGPDDHFLLRAVYDNTTAVEQDAMAGVFLFFATADGSMPEFDASQLHEEGHDAHSTMDHSAHGH